MVRGPSAKDLLRVMSPNPICKSAIARVPPYGFHQILDTEKASVHVTKMTTITPPIFSGRIGDHAKRLMTSGCLSLAMSRGSKWLNSREKIETFSRACKHGIQDFLSWWPLKSSQLLEQKRVTGFLIGVCRSGRVLGVLSDAIEGLACHQWHQRDFIHGKRPK